MRAHFASDVVTPEEMEVKIQSTIPSSKSQHKWLNDEEVHLKSLQSQRIIEFKMDSNQMATVCEFIDEILQRAETEAFKRQQRQDVAQNNIKQSKAKSQKSNLTDLNGKMGTMARTFVVRVFDAISNCANNAATAPIGRFKLRNFKKTSVNTSSGVESGLENVNNSNIDSAGASKTATAAATSIQTNETIEETNGTKSDFSFTNKLKKSFSSIKEKKEKHKSKLIAKDNSTIQEEVKLELA